MELLNKTDSEIEEILQEYVKGYPVENLFVRVAYTKENACTPYSGVCYYKKDKIRISINPKNSYPIKIKIGSPFDKNSWEFYQMNSAEELVSFVFLHEISHYLDYKNGIATGCKQTKADKFALWKMNKL